MNSLISTIILILLISFSYEYSYNITISSPNEFPNGTIPLTRGIFTPITIFILPFNSTTYLPLDTEIRLSNTNKFTTPQSSYSVKTPETRIIETFIGIPCNAHFTENDLSFGTEFSFISSSYNSEFISTPKHIIIKNTVNEFDIIASSKIFL